MKEEEYLSLRATVIDLLNEVKRKGMDELNEYLIHQTDYFEAPASTKYHNCFKGGLMLHSYNVFRNLLKKNDYYKLDIPRDTIIITAILHDVCKLNSYVKKGNIYKVEDTLPLGHGEKSIFIISKFIELTTQETLMIRWHMNNFDVSFSYGKMSLNGAVNKDMGVVALFTSDYEASVFLDER